MGGNASVRRHGSRAPDRRPDGDHRRGEEDLEEVGGSHAAHRGEEEEGEEGYEEAGEEEGGQETEGQEEEKEEEEEGQEEEEKEGQEVEVPGRQAQEGLPEVEGQDCGR